MTTSYRARQLASAVEHALRVHPVVVVAGARQTGKTTLVRHLPSAADRTFLSLDDIDIAGMAADSPDDLLARAGRLALDEVQRVPALLLAIKRDVDRRRRAGRFLLTGSANLLLMKQVSDSLAGRAVYLHLLPMTYGEKTGRGSVPPWSALLSATSAAQALRVFSERGAAAKDVGSEILRGGMPVAAFMKTQADRTLWFDGFVRTYLERDLREVSQISSLPDFHRLMALSARRIAQLVNQTELGRDAALPQATAHRYLNLLETTFQIFRLPAFSSNASTRLIKTPKLYWADTGLGAHLAGARRVTDLARLGLYGPLLENLVLIGLLAYRESARPSPDVFYFRTAGGAEVDFVIEHGDRLLPVEVKARRQLRPADLRHIESFLDDRASRAPYGLVLCETAVPLRLSRRVVALPLAAMV